MVSSGLGEVVGSDFWSRLASRMHLQKGRLPSLREDDKAVIMNATDLPGIT